MTALPIRSYVEVRKVKIPTSSRIEGIFKSPDLSDAYEVLLPDGSTDNPEILARHLHANPAPWFGILIRLRDCLVSPFGIKTSIQFRKNSKAEPHNLISFFGVYERTTHEIIFGQNDIHLDFRSSVIVRPSEKNSPQRRLVAVTVVECHNFLGKVYLYLIAPFHRLVVVNGLRHAAKIGWPIS